MFQPITIEQIGAFDLKLVPVAYGLGTCWLYPSGSKAVYAMCSHNGHSIQAHRFALAVKLGCTVQWLDEFDAAHSPVEVCMGGRCCHPDHLFKKTPPRNRSFDRVGTGLNGPRKARPELVPLMYPVGVYSDGRMFDELTTFDILKRKMPDARIYYLLHIKPSKFDRARVVPIGDGLGRVLAEIIRYVKRFYNSESVPVCDHWDLQEKRPRPPAPYLIQGIRHPSTAGIQTIRSRIREISIDAGARRSNGSPLVLLPHDCRRVFASEHLNNNTPVHVIQALLGHASPDTVMIYAKLYPSQLIEEYRKTVRSLYNAYYGEDGLKNPTSEEWAAFAANCNLRDMGTHLCALPTGEHCPKGLICLGCAHAQPKRSAVPIFRRMLSSHERSLAAARAHIEPAGQIAAREMEIVRIKGALQRAEELSDDVAAAIERAL